MQNIVPYQQQGTSRKLGTADWMHPDQAEQNFTYNDGKFWLGRNLSHHTPIGFKDDRHICLVSGNRGGKGTTTIIPNIALWPGSIVVIDPKGENASVTAARRGQGSPHCKGMGQKVLVLDPFKQATIDDKYRARFNPLDAIDPNSPEAIDDAARLADAIVVTGESKDPHWDESARSILKILILHVLTLPIYEGRRTLSTVRQLILQGEKDMVSVMKKKGRENIPSAQIVLWDMVRRNEAVHGLIAQSGEHFHDMAVHSSKEFNSVKSVAARNTEFLDSPGMKDVLSASDFELSELKTDPKGVSLFLTLPQRSMSTHFRWLRMMTTLVITEMEKTRGQPKTGHHILMCLDEFAGLKRMEIIENAVAQIAGYGVKLFFILQSLEQLKAVYPERWETFLSNASLKIFYSIEDHFTREYVSKFVGETEVIRELKSGTISEGTQETDTQGFSKARSQTETKSKTQGDSTGTSTSESYSTNSSKDSGARDGNILKPGELLIDSFTNAFGGNVSQQWGKGKQTGSSTNSSQNESSSQAFAAGTTDTDTNSRSVGRTQSRSDGYNQSLQKTLLITPDEIGKAFARRDDIKNPHYPGFALVLVSGQNPLILQRSNYFEDIFFSNLFDTHPDHKLLKEEHRPLLPYYLNDENVREVLSDHDLRHFDGYDHYLESYERTCESIMASFKPGSFFQNFTRHFNGQEAHLENVRVMKTIPYRKGEPIGGPSIFLWSKDGITENQVEVIRNSIFEPLDELIMSAINDNANNEAEQHQGELETKRLEQHGQTQSLEEEIIVLDKKLAQSQIHTNSKVRLLDKFSVSWFWMQGIIFGIAGDAQDLGKVSFETLVAFSFLSACILVFLNIQQRKIRVSHNKNKIITLRDKYKSMCNVVEWDKFNVKRDTACHSDLEQQSVAFEAKIKLWPIKVFMVIWRYFIGLMLIISYLTYTPGIDKIPEAIALIAVFAMIPLSYIWYKTSLRIRRKEFQDQIDKYGLKS